MNIEDYRDEKTHAVKELEAANKKLKEQLKHAKDENGDLNIKILELRARVRELEYRYEDGPP